MFQDKKIGERFKYKGVTLEVVDIYNSDCAGCLDCFFNDIGCENISCSPYTGRKADSVCFKVVEEEHIDTVVEEKLSMPTIREMTSSLIN